MTPISSLQRRFSLALLLLAAPSLACAQGVGIGTTSPTQALDVNGQVRVRGLSGTSAHLPIVQADGTLDLYSPAATADPYAVVPVLRNPNPAGGASGGTHAYNPRRVAVSGTIAYVASSSSGPISGGVLELFDLSDPAAPVLLNPNGPMGAMGITSLDGDPQGVAVSGTTVYVVSVGASSGGSILQVFDCSNPAAPALRNPSPAGTTRGGTPTTYNPQGVAVSGTTAYMVGPAGVLQVFDCSNPAAPVLRNPSPAGGTSGGTTTYGGGRAVAASGTLVYVATAGFPSPTGGPLANTLQVFDCSNPAAPVLRNPSPTASTNVGAPTYGSARSIAVSGTTAYLANDDTNTLQVFDCSNPVAPVLRNPSPAGGTTGGTATDLSPQSIAVSGLTAYVVNGSSNTLQVFDCSNPAAPVLRNPSPAGGTTGGTATDGGPLSLAVSGTMAYVVTTNGILQAFQVGGGVAALGLQPDGSLGLATAPLLTLSGQNLTISGGNTVALAFVQNQTGASQSGGFNVSGNGTVGGTLAAANASVSTALTGSGDNIGAVVGIGIRADGGLNLGQSTTHNSLYLGYQAGQANTGYSNQFIGYQAGYANTSGGDNLFSGYRSGFSNTTGGKNLFSGYLSGFYNTTGSNNLFSGDQAGLLNTSGSNNLFSGYQSGYANTTGSDNLFGGSQSGGNNTTGSSNTALGANSGPASGKGTITNATALGANVKLTQSNTVVLGNAANVGIGTSAPAAKLEVVGNAAVSGNVGIGTSAPDAKLEVQGGADSGGGSDPVALAFGYRLGGFRHYLRSRHNGVISANGNDLDFYLNNSATAAGSSAPGTGNIQVLTLESNNGQPRVGIGTSTPAYTLDVAGTIRANNVSATSDARFKQHVRPISQALPSVLRLRGVRYEWNALGVQHGGQAGAGQVGLIAQEVELVYPELVSTDAQGYKSVNYAQLTPVLLEALKEQQAQLEALKTQNTALQTGVTADHTRLLTLQAQVARLLGEGVQAQK